MNKKNDGGPAFPFGQISEATGLPINGYHNDGMSLRDYLAAKAMQAFITHCGNQNKEEAARLGYQFADAMLKEREKREDYEEPTEKDIERENISWNGD